MNDAAYVTWVVLSAVLFGAIFFAFVWRMFKFFRRKRSLDRQLLPLASLNISTLLICVLYSDPLAVSYLQSAWQQDVVRSLWLSFLCLGASLSLRAFLAIHARIHSPSRRVLRLLDIVCAVLAIAMAICCLLAPLPGLLSLSANLVVGVAAVFVIVVVSLIEVFALTTLRSLLVGPGHRDGKKSTEAEMSAARLMRILKGIRWLIVMDVLVVLVPAILFYAETVTTLTGQAMIVLAQEVVLALNYMAAVSAFSRPSTAGHLTPGNSERHILHSPNNGAANGNGGNGMAKSPNGPRLTGGLASPSFNERHTNAWAIAAAGAHRSTQTNVNAHTTLNHHHSNAHAASPHMNAYNNGSNTNGIGTITASGLTLGASQAHLLLSTPQLIISTGSITAHSAMSPPLLQLKAALAIAEDPSTPSPPSDRMILQSTTVAPHHEHRLTGVSLPLAPLTSSGATSLAASTGPSSASSTTNNSTSGASGAMHIAPLPPLKANGKLSQSPNINGGPRTSTVAFLAPLSSPSAGNRTIPTTPAGVAVTIAFPINGAKYTSLGGTSGRGTNDGGIT